MKHFLLSIALLAILITGTSQARLGYSEKEIRKELYGVELEVSNSDDETYTLGFESAYGAFFYIMDTNTKICEFCMYVMNSQGSVNAMVESFNGKYVILSDTEWRAYTDAGGMVDIALQYNYEHGLYAFIYTQ